MKKFIFFFFFSLHFSFAQKLHHQTISVQGGSFKLGNGAFVQQSVGQSSVVLGNYKGNKTLIGQGFIQGTSKSTSGSLKPTTATVIAYPIPATEVISFKFSTPLSSPIVVSLFDVRGRLVFTQKGDLIQNVFTMSIASLSEGVYFTKIESSNHVFSTKIIKAK